MTCGHFSIPTSNKVKKPRNVINGLKMSVMSENLGLRVAWA